MVTHHTRALKLLSAILILLLSPGWAELVENAEHLISDGHLAHATLHDSGEEVVYAQVHHEEAPCSPADHHCECCPSIPSIAPPEQKSALSPLFVDQPLAAIPYAGHRLARAIPPPLRPPTA